MNPTYDRETKVWSGPHKPSILNPEASFGQTLFAMMGLNPDRVIQIDVDTGRSMTCGEMRLRAIRAAQNLTALGLGQGDMVSMACANSENLVPMVLGLLINGMPFNSLSPEFGLDDVAHMMEITQPKLVFCDANNCELTMKAVELSVKIKPMIYVFESDMENVNKADDLLKETGRELMFLPPYLGDIMKQKPQSVGILQTNIKAKVVDDDGEVLNNGEQGELLVKFCEDFSGYYNNSKASAESVDADGWFRTGDIAYFDEEGFLFLVDRKKDLLKYRNYQIAPADLEDLIGKIDGVAQLRPMEVTSLRKKLLEFVHGTVADYKKLRGGVYFVSEIPLTSTGKPLRRKLRNDLIERLKM
ncbi:hypothetical protein quinque_009178 [Culex quinquefasciatus]